MFAWGIGLWVLAALIAATSEDDSPGAGFIAIIGSGLITVSLIQLAWRWLP